MNDKIITKLKAKKQDFITQSKKKENKNIKYLENKHILNKKTGEIKSIKYNLVDKYSKDYNYISSVSNHINQIAIIKNLVPIFLTITLPSKYHPTTTNRKNARIIKYFQIKDDILGSFGDEVKTGKPIDSDIREGKKTFLLLEANRLCDLRQKKILEKFLGDDKIRDDEIEQVRNVFRDCGALDTTRTMMDKLLLEGQNALDRATPPFNEPYKKFLLDLSNFLVKRDY